MPDYVSRTALVVERVSELTALLDLAEYACPVET
jgi:hypothetical protein